MKKIDMIKNYYATMLGYYSVSEIPVDFFLSLSKFIQREKILKEEVLSVTMTRKVKEVLEKDCKVKSAQLSRYIAKAVELNAMIKMGYRGVYKLHNFMIPESEWKNIKSIKCDFSFSTRKCYVKITKIKESSEKKMIEGRLGYNRKNRRYGLLVTDLWEVEGFHCGQQIEVQIAGEWIDTRFEMNPAGQWYLVGTDLVGDDLEFLKARI